jgi:hypothetical protein
MREEEEEEEEEEASHEALGIEETEITDLTVLVNLKRL